VVRRVRQDYMSQGKKALKDSAKDDLKKYEDDVQVRIYFYVFFFFNSFLICRPTVSSRLLPVINADRKRATHKKKRRKCMTRR